MEALLDRAAARRVEGLAGAACECSLHLLLGLLTLLDNVRRRVPRAGPRLVLVPVLLDVRGGRPVLTAEVALRGGVRVEQRKERRVLVKRLEVHVFCGGVATRRLLLRLRHEVGLSVEGLRR